MPLFAHLRIHSEYSFLRSSVDIDALVGQAQRDGVSALGLADFNSLGGAVRFQAACDNKGIKPIVGMKVNVQVGDSTSDVGRVVLLAQDRDGFRSLCHLSAHQHAPNRNSKHLKLEALDAHSKGLILFTGGWFSPPYTHLSRGDNKSAMRYLGKLSAVIGERNTYVSLERHRQSSMDQADEVLRDISKRLGLKMVMVHPIYAMNRNELVELKLRAAIRLNCTLDQVPDDELPGKGLAQVDRCWLPPVEMLRRFSDVPQAVSNTLEIAERCQTSLPSGKPIFPRINLQPGESVDEVLSAKAFAGMEQRFNSHQMEQARTRLQHELTLIHEQGFAPLFLLVADAVRFAREKGIPMSTRGSVANSLVAYCTGITTVDPIEHDLLFERFLSPARLDPPDIDLDFCSKRRDEILDYLRQQHGQEYVANVATINRFQPRSAIRAVAKAYGLPEKEISSLTKRFGRYWRSPASREETDYSEHLAKITDHRQRNIAETGLALVGTPHHLSVHPGGVVITPSPLPDHVPVFWGSKGWTTQLDHRDIEKLGLPKLDLLGIRALTVVAEAERLVKQHKQPDFIAENLPHPDADTTKLLQSGGTIGVFQCESAGAQRTLRQLKASNIRDLAVANAFFKPGPARGGQAQAFVRRYRGEARTEYLHPSLEPILAYTKGVLIFQEQVLRVATEIAGLSWEDADRLRRGMAKFKRDEMNRIQQRFMEGCKRHRGQGGNYSQNQAQTLWDQVKAFSGYGFNQGHATAYAQVSYRSAYLKAHFAAEFMTARLAFLGGYYPATVYMAEAIQRGIQVKPPHVNYSSMRCTLTFHDNSPTIWLGLRQVKSLRRSAAHEIIDNRPFSDINALISQVGLQEKEAAHLVKCGALDGLGSSRSDMLKSIEGRVHRSGRQASFQLFESVEIPKTMDKAEQLIDWEQEILGFPVSVHPLELVRNHLPEHISISDIGSSGGRRVTTVGCRLPARTGGLGFLFWDGKSMATVRTSKQIPSAWAPVAISGRWRKDAWGGGWFDGELIKFL